MVILIVKISSEKWLIHLSKHAVRFGEKMFKRKEEPRRKREENIMSITTHASTLPPSAASAQINNITCVELIPLEVTY